VVPLVFPRLLFHGFEAPRGVECSSAYTSLPSGSLFRCTVLVMDLGFVSLLFNVLPLLACASLCAYTIVIPVDESTPQEDLQWCRMSDMAAAAAAAAVQEASPGPSRETV